MEISVQQLVRDNIPLTLKRMGSRPKVKILNDEEFRKELYKRLQKSISEFGYNYSIDKLAEILDVIYTISQSKGTSIYQLNKLREEKISEHGSFNKKQFLDSIK